MIVHARNWGDCGRKNYRTKGGVQSSKPSKPMSMDRISVVSTKTLSAESIQKLSDAGMDCSAHDFVRTAPRKQFDPVKHETVLVTSQNALHGCDWVGRTVLCVGEGTAEQLSERGAQVHSITPMPTHSCVMPCP